MNIQEILKNLSKLESELQNIKSARAMAEETIGSYQETQKEIAKLIGALDKVGASLVTIAQGLNGQDTVLSEKVSEAVGKIDSELAAIRNAFREDCGKSEVAFSESVGKAIEGMRGEIGSIKSTFEEGNAVFLHNLETLGQLQGSISASNEDVKSMKTSSDWLRKELESFGERQEKAISAISENCDGIAAKIIKLDERQKAVEERLQKMESFIEEDSDIRKSEYGNLQKSSRRMQVYLIIGLLLLIFLVIYPFAKEFLHI